MNQLIYGAGLNPWHNLAVEKQLFRMGYDGVILYLWQNANTVVIGKNQNAWRECDLAAMERDGVKLARRESGGGAVFHDIGNLNFTFLVPNELYDVRRQLSVIQKAIAAFGLETEQSGRNDLLLKENGCKFSGNAFQRCGTHSLHHGTILIAADTAKAQKYLTPSLAKLQAKGVDSVRSRICNLSTLNPAVTVEALKPELEKAFAAEYGEVERMAAFSPEDAEIAGYEAVLSSFDWRIGKAPECTLLLEHKFSWGEIQLHLTVLHGAVTGVKVYTDALDETLLDCLPPVLEGCPASAGALSNAVSHLNYDSMQELSRWLAEQAI